MAKKRDQPSTVDGIKLQQPDRSGPTEPTLLQFANERNLFQQAELRQRELNRERKRAQNAKRQADEDSSDAGSDDEDDEDGDDEDDEDDEDSAISPRAERILDTLLWVVCLTTLHYTLDVLVQNQYAMAIQWPQVMKRAFIAFPLFCLLFYNLHRHPSDPTLIPRLPIRFQAPVRQSIFCVFSTVAGCYLVHITNTYGYIAVMKQAPPLGCLWVWAVIELELGPAVMSLTVVGIFYWLMESRRL